MDNMEFGDGGLIILPPNIILEDITIPLNRNGINLSIVITFGENDNHLALAIRVTNQMPKMIEIENVELRIFEQFRDFLLLIRDALINRM